MNIDTNQGMTLEKKVSTILDSKDLINQILDTYYGTENERDDIRRNIAHIELLLTQSDVYASILDQELLPSINDVIARSQSVLGN